MEGHKDISEMSFEEFFSESGRKEKNEDAVRVPEPVRKAERRSDAKRGFDGSSPKINYRDRKFILYIPRFTGGDSDQFNTAIDCRDVVIPTQRLESIRRQGARITRPSEINLTDVGVSPMDEFKLVIDGEVVFTNRSRDVIFFNNIGLPQGKPVGDVTAVYRRGLSLRLVKADVVETYVSGDLEVARLDVSIAGGVWIEDRKQDAEESPAEPEAEMEKKAEPVKKTASKKPAKRVKVAASISMPIGSKDADVLFDGNTMPLYVSYPDVTISVEGCDPSECSVLVRDHSGEIVFGRIPAENGKVTLRTGPQDGGMTAEIERDGKVIASSRYFLIPDFECSYSGKGDIPEDPEVSFTIFGTNYSKSIYDSDVGGPYGHGDSSFEVLWYIPAVTFDLGDGPIQYQTMDMDVDDLPDTMVVSAKGTRKRKLFFGGDKGKKTDLTPDWDGGTYQLDLKPLKEEMYSNPSVAYNLFITVNSFPNRRFMTIRNPVRMTASFQDGVIMADVGPQSTECICRLYTLDKTTRDVPLSPGHNEVPVEENVIEAEIMEMHNGNVRTSVPVKVRSMPFLHRDPTGDFWLYVSKSKRIPLPEGLIVNGSPDFGSIREWHGRIVRMNPELRDVTYPMIQAAFTDARY